MRIDVRDILKTSGLSKTVDLELTPGSCGINGPESGCEFSEAFLVRAELCNIKGIIRVKGIVRTGYSTYCARCLKPVYIPLEQEFDDEYAPFGALGPVSAEDADVYEYSDKEVDVGVAVRDAILLNLPIRHLCGEGCLSLCQVCGKDLNEGGCGCVQTGADARLAPLNAYFRQL